MVDGIGLENRRTRKGIGGSNPSLSANILIPNSLFLSSLILLRTSIQSLTSQFSKHGDWPVLCQHLLCRLYKRKVQRSVAACRLNHRLLHARREFRV